MSGPKVVKVVTREEKVARSSAQISRYKKAAARWINDCEKLGVIDAQDLERIKNIEMTLLAYLTADNFEKIQNQVPLEITFFATDLDFRRSKVIQKNALKLQVKRQARENAESLLKEITQRKLTIDATLQASLTEIAVGQSVSVDVQSILAQGFNALILDQETAEVSAAQQQQANNLLIGQNFNGWAKIPKSPHEKRLQIIDQKLAELVCYLDDGTLTMFSERIRTIESSPQDELTNVRIDSIIVDISSAVNKVKADLDIITQAHNIQSELTSIDSSNEKIIVLSEKMDSAIATNNITLLTELIAEANQVATEVRQQLSAQCRRTAILSGLSSLGYEVREEMHTALAKSGRIVLQKPNLPGYGVELAGPLDATRMQVRAVTFDKQTNPSRERDVETIWCNDFKKLQEKIAKEGGELTIERALEIGSVPMQFVDTENKQSHSLNIKSQHQ